MFQESATSYRAAGELEPIQTFIESYRIPLMAVGLTILGIILILIATKGGVKTLVSRGGGSEGNSSALRETSAKTVAVFVCAAILGLGTFGLGLAAQLGKKAGGDQRQDVEQVMQDMGVGGEGAG